MALNLNKDGGDKKKFNLTKTSDSLPGNPEADKSSISDKSTPRKSNNLLWIVVGAIVIGGGIWFLTSKSSDKTPSAIVENNQAVDNAIIDSSSIAAPVSDTVSTAPVATTTSNPTANDTKKVEKPDLTPQKPEGIPTKQPKQELPKPEDTSPILTTNNSKFKSSAKSSAVAKSKDKTHTNFSAGSANLNKLSNELVKEIADFVAKNPNSKVTINGYASSEGDLNTNQVLSQKRADSVKDYLVSKGIPSSQLVALGKGVENPIGDNNTIEGRMQNRRTEIVY